jgi:hypothetical protein
MPVDSTSRISIKKLGTDDLYHRVGTTIELGITQARYAVNCP